MENVIYFALQHLLGQQHQIQRLKETELRKKAGSVLGTALDRTVQRTKLLNIMDNTADPPHNTVMTQQGVSSALPQRRSVPEFIPASRNSQTQHYLFSLGLIN